MSRKKRRDRNSSAHGSVLADLLPPESRPHNYYSRLLFANPAGDSGPLGIIGRELQLVWYQSKRDRDRDRHGKLVSVLEFRDCRRSRGPFGDGYRFSAVLIEDMSGEYREWAGHQAYPDRHFGPGTEVRETEVQFSVFLTEGMSSDAAGFPAAGQPFLLHHPDVQELSSPQLDLLFDAMSALHRSLSAMLFLEELRAQRAAELAEPKAERNSQLPLASSAK